MLQVNVESLFALSQAVAEPMRAQGSGSVINMSSMFSFIASAPVPEAGYVASKSAVNGLTRELAVQWAGDGIRVQRDRAGLVPERDDVGALRRRAHRGGSSGSARWAVRAGSTSSTASFSSSPPTPRRTARDR